MREYQGTIRELSASTTNAADNGETIYSYVEIGDAIIKKLKAMRGIRSKMETALSEGRPVTLYVESNYLCGIKMADGRVFASEVHGLIQNVVGMIFWGVVGVLTLVILLGIVMLQWAYLNWQRVSAYQAAQSLPNAIFV